MNDIVFIILLVLAGVLAFALTIYVINLVRKGRGGSAPQKEKKPGNLPDDEHKGAEAVVRQLRRYAALHEYKVVAPVAVTGVHGTTDLDAVLVGWFGVQNAVFGQGMAEIVPFTDFLGTQEILPGIMAGITPEYIFWAIITGLGITLLVVFGIKAIANFATVFVPLFVIVVIVAAAIILQNHSLTELLTTAPPGPALSLGAATTMVAGGFIAGAICTPDYARFLKNGTQVFWMTLIGTFVGELGMNLLAVLLAHAMGTENIVDIMMGTSGIIGVIIVVASTVKLNDINLYSSSLGLATMINALFNKAISRNGLVWALGIVGTLLSVIGIINYFTNFLTLLGVAIPPVAGIMVVDYFILKRSRATLDASRAKGELPEKVEKWNPIAIVCWIAGFAVGEVTSIMNVGIPGLNSLILAGVLYWIVMKVYASMKKVDTVTFTETDQVL